MQLEDAEADATEDELAAERTAPSTLVKPFERKRPARKPFPDHLPRERVVIAAPTNCPCCGSTKLSKLGEDVTETLEVVRQWKVIQTVRERFSCRQCEAITQPPAPFHVTPRGFAGPRRRKPWHFSADYTLLGLVSPLRSTLRQVGERASSSARRLRKPSAEADRQAGALTRNRIPPTPPRTVRAFLREFW
jgi:hypothetical protein